jgi:hypothetical protein
MFSTQCRIAAAVLLASAGIPALAGGFYVLLGNPEASSKAKAAGAVVTIKLAGCHEPEKANVTAVAIGKVDDQRQSVPLTLTKLSEPGMYAVTRQWREKGNWVLQFIATDGERVASTLVAAGAKRIEREKAVMGMKPATESEIAGLLANAQTH